MIRAVFAILTFVLVTVPAQADIELSPLRQVLTPHNPEAEFVLSNPSNRILEGRVTWLDLSATKTGYVEASPAVRRSLSAAPYITLSPAQFRLEPGSRMTVKIKLKEGVEIPKGERRSHLLIESAASRTPIRKASNRGLQVDIGVSVSAPVLLRREGAAGGEIGATRLLRDDEGMLFISTEIVPTGDISTYGRLIASFNPSDRDEGESILGIRENVAGFLDAEKRHVEIPLGYFSLGSGELTLRYEGASEFKGREFDRRIFEIAPLNEE